MNGRLQGPEGRALAKETLDLMERYDIAPTPENYAVFSCYTSDSLPELCEAISKRIESGEPFDQPFCDMLYSDHFAIAKIQEAVMASSGAMAKELVQVRETLKAAERHTAEYGETLAGAEGAFDEDADPGHVRDVIRSLVSATTKMQTRSKELERRLQETSSEVVKLRSNLERVREEAMTDALTGIANRKRFDEMLRKGRRSADTNNDAMCLILCDIDYFKRFNDTWGHQTGDQIIRFVAGCMTRNASDHHTVARYGGEEFAVVMPKATLPEANALAEKIRMTVEGKRLLRKSTSEDLGNITISLGVSEYRHGEAIEELIERADANLYKSKKDGRNRVTTDSRNVRSAA
ncbi:GGDEF domain-containing protein [Hyphobacterium sp. HN65]|uniref:diguanylate cyclase n=1 Tax=Hyphobacterium lacteum TaxID=3116575 RepID=A0ABU7LLP5_9PROT|nr:GGDEF domain-containing protein [Hyphobacterium sp. HN65]MEE2524839.1 GGDEF domain-containing protein [Hyphobacterium sp. HN65]